MRNPLPEHAIKFKVQSIKQYNVKDHSFVAIGIVATCVPVSLITIQMATNSIYLLHIDLI